jgi:hypothetical protein
MNQHLRFETPFELFKRLNLMFYAVMGSMFLFLIIALLIQQPDRQLDAPPQNIMTEYILVILIIISISGAYIVYILGSRKVTDKTTLTAKVASFYKFSIFKLFMFETAGILGLAGYIVTAVPLYLAIGFVVIMLMFLHKPSFRRLAVEYKLTQQERDHITENRPFH